MLNSARVLRSRQPKRLDRVVLALLRLGIAAVPA